MAGRGLGFQFISFLSDFGVEAESVGICKGVIARINPDARVIDITHGVPAFDVAAGALALASAVPHLPVATHLAVVDPGVGGRRQAVALVVARGDVLVGPDNGLLRPAAEALGGILRAYRLENPEYMLRPVSATFHARDVFGPAAAHLSRGVDPAELGPEVVTQELMAAPWQDRWLSKDQWLTGVWEGVIVGFDQYGSARLDLRFHPEDDPWSSSEPGDFPPGELTVRLTVSPLREGRGSTAALPLVHTYSDVPPGSPCLVVDSDGRLLIAVNQGSARRQWGLAVGQRLVLDPTTTSEG